MHVTLTSLVTACDCCGKQNLKRTVAVHGGGDVMYLGVVCAGRWFGVNMRGDPHAAARRLQNKIREGSLDEFRNVAHLIRGEYDLT